MHLRSPWHRSLLWLDAEADDASPAYVPIDPGPHADALADTAALERALASLPALTRSVVWLHDVEGYTHHEIGRLFGRTTAFSKSQLARAHVRLRNLLDPQPPELQGGSLTCTPLSTIC